MARPTGRFSSAARAHAAATRRDTRRLKGAEKIGERIGKVIGTYKMAKHFTWSIDDDGVFTHRRDDVSISAETRLDGLYVIRTSLPESELDAPGTVRAYKRLSSVERAFRSLKTVDLKVHPVFHRTEPRVRAHVFLCMLAYYVGMAHAPEAQSCAVRRRGCRRRRGPAAVRRRSGDGLAECPGQGGTEDNAGRRSGAQLPHPPRRSCHHHPQHSGAPACRAPSPSRSPRGPRRSRQRCSNSWA